jgi:hypothetical protein
VCCSAPHAMVPHHDRGQLHNLLPTHCTEHWAHCDSSIRQALLGKHVRLDCSDISKPVMHERSGCQMLWRLAHLAGHPRLSENFVDPGSPHQRSSMELIMCGSEWITRLHLHYYQGTFLSDRYFAETFVTNMSAAMNALKAHIHAQIRRVPHPLTAISRSMTQ